MNVRDQFTYFVAKSKSLSINSSDAYTNGERKKLKKVENWLRKSGEKTAIKN